MRMLARVQDALELMFEYVAIALLAIMMVLVTADTAGRYLLHKPVFGTHEFVEAYLMVGVVFLGMARLQGGRSRSTSLRGTSPHRCDGSC